MLKGAQIIGWHCVSDRIMPDSSKEEMVGDHSTVSHVQHISALNGVWAICATRSGIETNPHAKAQLYYNGGSSIWNPLGHKVKQVPFVAPLELKEGLHGIYTTTIDLALADKAQEKILKRTNKELYNPLLTLHRAPTDPNASKTQVNATLKAAQWPSSETKFSTTKVGENELLVLPAFSGIPYTDDPKEILAHAEPIDGPFEQKICELSKSGKGYIVGSYPQKDNDKYYHTIVLAGPQGQILARYQVTHLNQRDSQWATPGSQMVVTPTAIGRIGLAASYELEISEVGGMLCALRADILAVPCELPCELKVEIDKNLYSIKNPPTGKANYYTYAAATLNQMWVVCGARPLDDFTSCGIYAPEPIVFTYTLLAGQTDQYVELTTKVPANYTWINQERLISTQVAIWFPTLVQ